MPALRTPWASQPNGLAAVASSSLLNNVAFVVNFGAGLVDSFNSRIGSPGGTLIDVCAIGTGLKAQSNAAIGATFTPSRLVTSDGAGTGDFSILIIADPTASATREFFYCSTSGSTEFYFGANFALGLAASSGNVGAETNSGGPSGVYASSQADSKHHVWLYTRQAGIGSLYRDGLLQASSAVSAAVMWGAGSVDRFGGYSAAGWGISRSVALGVGWNRGLSPLEAAQLSNPTTCFSKIFTPLSKMVQVPMGVAVYRPGTDVLVTGWSGTPESAHRANNINESTASDASTVMSPAVDGTQGPLTFTWRRPIPAGAFDIRIRGDFLQQYTGQVGQVRVVFLDASLSVVGTGAWKPLTGAFAAYTDTITLTGVATQGQLQVQAL